MSLGREFMPSYDLDACSDAADGCEAPAAPPSSPPQSPGRFREAWAGLKQWEEELEGKQRNLEEWDFELQEEKRQHRESRLFLARKMSELEARELRAAKQEERRLSALSGTPTSSVDMFERTPPSSSKKLQTPLRDMPCRTLEPSLELVDNGVQTEEIMEAPATAALPQGGYR